MALVERIKGLFVSPNLEWIKIKGEEGSIGGLFKDIIIPLAAISPISGIIGVMIFGLSFGFGSYKPPISVGVSWVIVSFSLSLIHVVIISTLVETVGKYFGLSANKYESYKIVVYSYIPIWLAGLFSIVPQLSVLKLIAGIYSYFLLYIGIKLLKNVPKERIIGYYLLIVSSSVIIFWIFGSIAGSVLASKVL